MDPMLIIPKDRKRLRTGRLCLLIGLTALLFLTIAHRYGAMVEAIAPGAGGG